MDIKQMITHLLQQEFGDVLAHIEFFGPHEEEDLDAIVWLHEGASGYRRPLPSHFSWLAKREFGRSYGIQNCRRKRRSMKIRIRAEGNA